ncbi:hypothetical protein HK107_08870 [Parvularcula sp. ZS-1/3]|uniref:Transmembrane protein (PGPGW) n=1 Tax=Parvularcula mediterranea TaxID=2732508 RepID=A0A7Y3W5M4_9PROT|nr:hypothetical protein [Parvularcula mediterranea]NNU16431.1 hypothetical protein [Parvularcula mediterranea]
MLLWRIIGNVVGAALVLIGIPLTLSPIPLGLLILFIGVVILVASNPYAAKLLKAMRKRWPWLNRFFRKAENVLPDELAGPLHETESDEDEDSEKTPERATASLGEPMRRVTIPRRLR